MALPSDPTRRAFMRALAAEGLLVGGLCGCFASAATVLALRALLHPAPAWTPAVLAMIPLASLAGALLAQQQGAADINMGRGAIVIGLAAVIVGEALFQKKTTNFALRLLFVVCGAIIYWFVFQTVIFIGLPTELLKMLSALVVALFLGVPYLKSHIMKKKKKKEVKTNA